MNYTTTPGNKVRHQSTCSFLLLRSNGVALEMSAEAASVDFAPQPLNDRLHFFSFFLFFLLCVCVTFRRGHGIR